MSYYPHPRPLDLHKPSPEAHCMLLPLQPVDSFASKCRWYQIARVPLHVKSLLGSTFSVKVDLRWEVEILDSVASNLFPCMQFVEFHAPCTILEKGFLKLNIGYQRVTYIVFVRSSVSSKCLVLRLLICFKSHLFGTCSQPTEFIVYKWKVAVP